MSYVNERLQDTTATRLDLPPNHHADARQFAGIVGYLAALTMVGGRGADARFVAEVAAVDESSHVLDIGCGPGTAARVAARRGASVTGLDPAAPMLRVGRFLTRVRQPSRPIEWRQAGAEDLGLPDATITVCWSLASVHHWPDLENGLAEVWRVLQPGGTFIAGEKRTKSGASGLASHGWTADQAARFAELLRQTGFTDVRVDDHDLRRRSIVLVTGHKPPDRALLG